MASRCGSISEIPAEFAGENSYTQMNRNLNPIIDFNGDDQINLETEILRKRLLAEKVALAFWPMPFTKA